MGSVLVGLLFTSWDYIGYYTITGNAIHWHVGLIVVACNAFPLIGCFVFGNKYARLSIRGLGALLFILSFIYGFGIVSCLYPLIYRPLTPLVNIALTTAFVVIVIAWTGVAFYDLRAMLKATRFHEKAFLERSDTIEFDLSNLRKWQQESKKRDPTSRLYYWLLMIVAPAAPVLSSLLSNFDKSGSLFYYILAAIAFPIFLWIWRGGITGILGLFVYPLYLEFKTGKPVVEVGSQWSSSSAA